MKQVIGFDIDGVIAFYPYRLKLNPIITFNLYRIISKLYLGEKIIHYFYQKRKPNKSIIDFISKLKKEFKIVLITSFKNKEIAEKWLNKNNVKYDKLYVWDGKCPIIQYKLEKIKKLQVKIFIDDSKNIVKSLPKEVKGIHYKRSEQIINKIKNFIE